MSDLHLHTVFSDGAFPPVKIVESAIESGLTEIGFCDHFNTTKTQSLRPDALAGYLDLLDDLAERHRADIIIRKAVEIDLRSVFLNGTGIPRDSDLERLDYVLFEYASEKLLTGIPLKHTLDLRASIPKPTGLAHTDLMDCFPKHSNEDLIAMLQSAEVFIECNDSYYRPGEMVPYYQYLSACAGLIRTSGLRISCGSDMHDNLDDLGAERANIWIRVNGLQSNQLKLGAP